MSPPPSGSRRARWAFAVAVVVNLVVLYAPRAPSDGGVPDLDKLVHVLVFVAVAWTGVRAGLPVRWLLPVLVAHAVASELVQHYLLPGRSGDPADAVADVLGAAAGVALGRRGGSWGHGGVGGGDGPDRPSAGRDPDAG